MFTTYFSSQQILIFCLFGILQLLSIYFFSYKNNIKYAMLFLFAGSVILRLLMVCLDEHLHIWDEQYHALVAKNMVENPLRPMLYKNTPLEYNYTNWTANHVWLHKQPLFLWQIALSIKLFGNSVFAVRLPGAIMFSLLILVIFRIGKILVNERVGYVSAFLFSVNNYLLEFITGIEHTDHNDIAFIFYVTLSIWAFAEYSINKRKHFIWLIGIFAGLAILNKWLVGLLVFSGWSISVLFISGSSDKLKEIKNILKAVLVCILVFVPWQLYILTAFPMESHYEFGLNSKHFFEAVEGHEGDYLYHFEQAKNQYGKIISYLLPLALFIFFRDVKNISARVGFITFVVLVYLFFTLTKTKMPAFCLIVSPIVLLALGNFLYKAIHFSKNGKILKATEFALLAILGIVFLNIENIQRNHTYWITKNSRIWERKTQERATEFAKSLKGKFDDGKTVIFNCKQFENIPVMFFSGYTAYDKMPDTEEYNHLKENGYKMLFVDNYDSSIPENILNNKEVTILRKEKSKRQIHLKSFNGKFVCADEFKNIVIADRAKAGTWETLTLLILANNECLIKTGKNLFFSSELNQNGEITANRKKAGEWEIFTLVELDNHFVAFKAANNRFLSLDEVSLRIFASSNSIGASERFELIINSN